MPGRWTIAGACVLSLALIAAMGSPALGTSPPAVSTSFSSRYIALNANANLSIDIGNPNPGSTLFSVAFTDTLPPGLAVANPSNLDDECGGSATATPGTSTVSISSGVIDPLNVCLVSVDVTGTTIGDKLNGVQVNSSAGTSYWAYGAVAVDAPHGAAKLVKDIDPGISSSMDGTTVFPIGKTAYFPATDGSHGDELWKSNATASGTRMVKDINPSGDAMGADAPVSFANVRGTLFLSADDGTHGDELWKSDGTASGTKMVKDINPSGGSMPFSLTRVGTTVYFSADDGVHGVELWRSDGTKAGTRMVKNINPGGSSSPSFLANGGGTLFFTADDGVHGVELWRSNGTKVGTTIVKNINPGGDAFSASTPTVHPDFIFIKGEMYFAANDSVGYGLWRSNGTRTGTKLLRDYPNTSPPPQGLANLNGILLFSADDGVRGIEPWRSNGTSSSTRLVKDIDPAGASSDPVGFTDMNGRAFFSAGDGTHGIELWRTDGTKTGTRMVKDIYPGGDSQPQLLKDVGGTLLFDAADPHFGYELFRSDGTAAGTKIVDDINNGLGGAPINLTDLGGMLFFSDDDEVHGEEPWKYKP